MHIKRIQVISKILLKSIKKINLTIVNSAGQSVAKTMPSLYGS